jgi:hypothetical protein
VLSVVRRGPSVLLVLCLCAAAFWASRRGGGSNRRAPLPQGEVGEVPEPPRFPTEPNAFLQWLKSADAAALKDAGESLRTPGERSDALLRAVVEAVGPGYYDTPWAEDFFTAVGARAVLFLEAQYLNDPNGRGAFGFALRLADADEQQRFLVGCLDHANGDVQYQAAEWISGALTTDEEGCAVTFEASSGLRAALARAFARAPPLLSESSGLYSGPPPLSETLSDALVATIDGQGDALRELAADPAPEVRLGAARAVSEWAGFRPRPNGEPTDEDKQELEVWNARSSAAAEIGAAMLADGDERVRATALRSLDSLGRQQVAVPRDPVLARMVDPNEATAVRAAAASALASMEVDPTRDLVPYLADPDATVRAAVIAAVAEWIDYGNPLPELEPKLLASLDHADEHIRVVAADALDGYARKAGAPCRVRLVAGLEDPSESVRLACASSLFQSEAPVVEVVPHLVRWLKEGSEGEREAAINLAVSLGEHAAPLEPMILAAAATPDVNRLRRCLEALAGIPGANEHVFELAMRTNTEGDVASVAASFVRCGAIQVLAKRFPDRGEARDAVSRALSGKDQGVAVTAAKCLAERGRETQAVVRACVRVLDEQEDPDWTAQQVAIEVLGGCGVEAREAIPSLLRAVDQPPPWCDRWLVATLGRLKELAAETVPTLVDRAVQGKWVALAALDGLGVAAEPYLSAALGRLDPARREAFSKAQAAFRENSKAGGR